MLAFDLNKINKFKKEIVIVKLGTILIQCFLIFYLLNHNITKYSWLILASGLIFLLLIEYGFTRGWLIKNLSEKKTIDNP